jgi:hypothetical protein
MGTCVQGPHLPHVANKAKSFPAIESSARACVDLIAKKVCEVASGRSTLFKAPTKPFGTQMRRLRRLVVKRQKQPLQFNWRVLAGSCSKALGLKSGMLHEHKSKDEQGYHGEELRGVAFALQVLQVLLPSVCLSCTIGNTSAVLQDCSLQ